MKFSIKLSDPLLHLLHFSKNNDFTSWTQLKDVLQPLYGFDLKQIHVLKITFKAFAEALQHDQHFCMGLPDTLLQELLLSPLKASKVDMLSPEYSDAVFTLTDYYSGHLQFILNCFHQSVIDWSDQYRMLTPMPLIESV